MKSKKCCTMTNCAPPHCSWYSLYDSNSQLSLWRNFKMLDPIRSHLIYWANLYVLFAECLHVLLLSVTAWTQNWRESRISDEKPSRQATLSPLLDHMTTTMVAPAVLATLNLCFFILLLETVSAMSATYLWQCWDIIKNLLVGYNSYSTDTSSYKQQDLEIDLIAVD